MRGRIHGGAAAATRPGGTARFALGCALACALAALGAALTWPGASPVPAPTAAAPAVVSVSAGNGPSAGRATGFAVGDGRVVTVSHALDRAGGVTVRDGRRSPVRARVVRRDPRTDLALLAVPGLRAPAATIGAAGDERPVRLLVRRRGVAVARRALVRRAIDARVRGPGAALSQPRPALELRARVRDGDSGAPVMHGDGRLAGVVFARSLRHPRTAYAVEAAAVARLLRARGEL